MSVKLCEASAPTPLCAVKVMGYEPTLPVAGVPLSIPVAALKEIPEGRLPDSDTIGTGNPVAVTANEPALPTAKVVLLTLVINAGLWPTDPML